MSEYIIYLPFSEKGCRQDCWVCREEGVTLFKKEAKRFGSKRKAKKFAESSWLSKFNKYYELQEV